MIYSVMDYEQIYNSEIKAPVYTKCDNVIMELREDAYGTKRLSRIYSTELKDYLSEKFDI